METEVLEYFPEEWKKEFEGLLYLGHLETVVTSIPFHTFVVRTLTVNEKLGVSLITKDYQDTIGYGRAYRAAVVAAGLQQVDERILLDGAKGSNVLRQKFDYVTNGWYDSVIDILYAEIDRLEARVLQVLEEVGIINSNKPTPIFEDEEDNSDIPKDGK